MANKRVFVAFAIEDETTKILFTGQAKNKNVPYDFIDMSITPHGVIDSDMRVGTI